MDEVMVAPALHSAVGGIVLLAALVTTGLTWLGVRQGRFGPPQGAALIALQIALLVQTAVGIKLLDQGLGTVQKYVHYLGGLGAVGLLMLFYWLPRRGPEDSARKAAWLSTASLAFVALTFFVGQSFVRGGLS